MSSNRLSDRLSAVFLNHATYMSILCGCCYGYNAGIIGGLSKTIVYCEFFPNNEGDNQHTAIQATYQGVYTASIFIGAAIGSVIIVPIADRYGRKKAYLLLGLIGLLPILVGVIPNFWVSAMIRLLSGFSLASTCLAPLYVTETVSANIRGTIGTLLQLSITFFIFISQVMNFVFQTNYNPLSIDPEIRCINPSWKWKLQICLGAIPAVLIILHYFKLPESKAWLRRQDGSTSSPGSVKDKTEIDSVQHKDVEHNGTAIETTAEFKNGSTGINATATTLEQESEVWTWKQMFCSKKGLSYSLIGIGLGASPQLTGINGLIFYSNQVFNEYYTNVFIVSLCVVGLWNFLSVFPAVYLIDRVGRRPLMLVSLSGIALSCIMLAVFNGAFSGTNLANVGGPMTVFAIMVFLFFFETGPGSLFYIMASEVFPYHVRSKSLSMANASNNVANVLVSFLFPVFYQLIGGIGTFSILAGFCVFFVGFIYFLIPESKGKLND